MNSSKNHHSSIDHSRLFICKIVPYGLLLILFSGCVSQYTTQYQPVQSVVTTAYCEVDQVGETKALSATDQAILTDKQRANDETTAVLMLKKAAWQVVGEAKSVEDCEQVFKQGTALFQQLIEQNQQHLAQAKGFKPVGDPKIFAVQQRVTDLWRADQSARATLVNLPAGQDKDQKFWANRLASAHTLRIDVESTEYIEGLLENYDWIDQQRFGAPVSAHAWILIQHADDRVDLQAKVLRRMKKYFKNGGIKPANYAYLWDRVAVNSGELQRYGTQPNWECKQGQLELQPIEDLVKANELRQTLGMSTVEQGLAEMSRSVCGHQ